MNLKIIINIEMQDVCIIHFKGNRHLNTMQALFSPKRAGSETFMAWYNANWVWSLYFRTTLFYFVDHKIG